MPSARRSRWLSTALLCAACARPAPLPSPSPTGAGAAMVRPFTVQDSSDRVAVVRGLDGPEAVRYDPEQDVYFVANWAGGGSERDADGFISRVAPDGEVRRLRFMTGTADAPLHAPRGMVITGDTLWAVDVDGVHGFHRRSGAHLAYVDFTRFEPGFLNDVAAATDGTLYVTDTGRSRVYRLRGREATLALEDSLLGPPNGITRDQSGDGFVLAPWGGNQVFRRWVPGTAELVPVARSEGGNFDGIEPWGGGFLVASQRDSTVYLLRDGAGIPLIRTPGRGADIGVDTRRGRVAVPYVALDRVDVWEVGEGLGSR